MALPAVNVAVLDNYFATGGELEVIDNAGLHVERAMSDLMHEAKWSPDARRLFAQASIFERTLNPPSIVKSTFVRPSLQIRMLEPLYASLTGGFWAPPDPAGITSWIGSEAGGRAYFVSALNSPPRVETGLEIEMATEVLALLLKIIGEAALPASWFKALAENQVFQKIDVRIAGGGYGPSARKTLLALNAQASARTSAELAKLATAQLPSFPAGDGQMTPTVPPRAKPWYRSGWLWLGAGAAAVGGGVLAARR